MIHKEKELWYVVDESCSPSVLAEVFNFAYSTLLLPYSRLHVLEQVTLPQRIRLALTVTSLDEARAAIGLESIAQRLAYIVCESMATFEAVRREGTVPIGLKIRIDDRPSLDQAVAIASATQVLIIEFKDPTNIPLELVLATTQQQATRIFKVVQTAEDGQVSLLTMKREATASRSRQTTSNKYANSAESSNALEGSSSTSSRRR